MNFIEIQYAYGRRQKSLKTTTADPYCKEFSMEIRVIQYVHGGCKPFTHNIQLQAHCGVVGCGFYYLKKIIIRIKKVSSYLVRRFGKSRVDCGGHPCDGWNENHEWNNRTHNLCFRWVCRRMRKPVTSLQDSPQSYRRRSRISIIIVRTFRWAHLYISAAIKI